MAFESDLVSADMVELTEFPHLAQRYNVRGVPRTMINGGQGIDGAVPESAFADIVIAAASSPPQS